VAAVAVAVAAVDVDVAVVAADAVAIRRATSLLDIADVTDSRAPSPLPRRVRGCGLRA